MLKEPMNSGRSWRFTFQTFSPKENRLTALSLGLGVLSMGAYCFSVFTAGFLPDSVGSKNLLFGYCMVGCLTAIPAVILGHIGRNRFNRSMGQPDEAPGGKAGLVLGYLGIILAVFLWP